MFILMALLFCGQVLGVVSVARNGRIKNRVELQISVDLDFTDFNQIKYRGATFVYQVLAKNIETEYNRMLQIENTPFIVSL